MKRMLQKCGIAILSMFIFIVSSCSEDLDGVVSNSGIGNIQSSQVIAASSAIQNYYASKYSFSFNEDGLLSSIRNLQSGEIEVTYEYGKPSRSEIGTKSTNALSSGQVLMTIRQTEEYIFKLLFSIGENGYANSCVETGYDGTRTKWKFSYDAEGHLLRMNDGGDIATFKYDDKGRMVSHYDHDCWTCEVKFSYNDALCTAYPTNDDEWIKVHSYDPNYDDNSGDLVVWNRADVPNTLGLFTVVSEFTGYDPEFIFAYLAGLVGKPSSALPSKAHYDYHGELTNEDYRYLYLIRDDEVWDLKSYKIYDE